MECKDVEWAAFLFNAIGEDEEYIKYLKIIQGKIQIGQKFGSDIVEFLNKWRSRINSDVKDVIDTWYKENHETLNGLPSSLINAYLDDETIADRIKYIYRSLVEKVKGIGNTTASKTLHMLRPDLFVPWDIPIKTWYDSQLNQEDYKNMKPAEKYLAFLKKMQKEAKSLLQQNSNFLSELNSNVKKLYEGNLEESKNNEPQLKGGPKKSMKIKIDNYTEMINFMKNTGKTITKYLDEYNWVTITNAVKITPYWYPY